MPPASNNLNPADATKINQWIERYRQEQQAATASIPTAQVARLIEKLRQILNENRQLFAVIAG